MLSQRLLVSTPTTVRKPIASSAYPNLDALADSAPLGDSWPELLGVLFQLSIAPEEGKRETAFRVFTSTPGVIEKQHEDTVAQAFTRGFKDDTVSVGSPRPSRPTYRVQR